MKSTISPDKLRKLTQHIDTIIEDLHRNRELGFEKAEKLFYYMQKAEELKLLTDQLQVAGEKLKRLEAMACRHYNDIYCVWKNDLKWLSSLHRYRQNAGKTIL